MSQQALPCSPPPPPEEKKPSRVVYLVPPNYFLKDTVHFVGNPKDRVLHQNHSNPISTKLTLIF